MFMIKKSIAILQVQPLKSYIRVYRRHFVTVTTIPSVPSCTLTKQPIFSFTFSQKETFFLH